MSFLPIRGYIHELVVERAYRCGGDGRFWKRESCAQSPADLEA